MGQKRENQDQIIFRRVPGLFYEGNLDQHP